MKIQSVIRSIKFFLLTLFLLRQAGYQITQQRQPLATGGQIPYIVHSTTRSSQPETRLARFTQVQLEQDSGKSLHDMEQSLSLIDLNRAGQHFVFQVVTSKALNFSKPSISFGLLSTCTFA